MIEKNIYEDVPGQSEDALQQKCYYWFWNNYPLLRGCLFSVPNGGLRTKRGGKKLNLTGLYSGVSDLILMHKTKTYLIELKTETGSQKPNQKAWQKIIEAQGFNYFIIRSLEDFKRLINCIII